nr:PREDICTED: uncharacterized protein LOC103564281 isoform X1 [Equus przewalskii]
MPLEGTGHGSPSQAHTDLPRPACPAAPTTLSPPASPSLPRLLRHSGPHRPQAMGEYQPKSPSRTASLCSVPSARQRRRRGSRNTGGVSFSPGISCCLDAENLKELDPNLGYLVTKEVSQKFHLLFPNVALELKGLLDSRWPWGSLDEIQHTFQHTFVFPKSACQVWDVREGQRVWGGQLVGKRTRELELEHSGMSCTELVLHSRHFPPLSFTGPHSYPEKRRHTFCHPGLPAGLASGGS